jgi:pectate lyase
MHTPFLAATSLSFLLHATEASLPAFPGAEGYGAKTPGGRGGRVLFVDNLNDSGPGTLRAALETEGPRIVLFRTGGLITLTRHLTVRHPYLTVAGQTAPGNGICIRGGSLVIATHDVIIRHIRSRFGATGGEGDAISIATPSRRVILDHVSASWSVDESLSPSGDIADITVQWSMITESLNKSVHGKGSHGYGTLARATGGVTFHHNLWAHHSGRNPRFGDNYFKGDPAFYDFRNNVIYNWGSYCTGLVDGRIRVNYINNFLRYGPSSSKRNPIHIGDNASEETRFFLAGNLIDERPELTAANTRMFDRTEHAASRKRLVTIESKPFDAPTVQTTTAIQALDDVLRFAGATKPARDSVDTRVVETVRRKSGKIIDSPDDAGGWPAYTAGKSPLDADNDGIPDEWEQRNKLNPRDPADAAQTAPSGYTWLEVYLNELADPRR